MMNLTETIQLQVLKRKALMQGQDGLASVLMDRAIESGQVPELRQMCAKVTPELYQRLEQVCDLLDMTKRGFIEAAVSDAISKAEEALQASGVIA